MSDFTPEEQGIIDIVRMNKAEKRTEIRKVIPLWKYQVIFNWRSKKSLWGRFGGGWNWELGFQIGGSSVIVNCLIFSLRFHKKP